MPLTQEEIDGCRDAFLAFDKDRSGTIDVWELRQVLEGTFVAASWTVRGASLPSCVSTTHLGRRGLVGTDCALLWQPWARNLQKRSCSK